MGAVLCVSEDTAVQVVLVALVVVVPVVGACVVIAHETGLPPRG